MSSPQLALAGELTPHQVGQLVAAAGMLLALFAGMLKCLFIMRRPTTSRLCVSALLFFLAGWSLSVFGSVLALLSDSLGRPLMAVAGILTAMLMLVGLVLGIVGLATYDRARFVQGRAQATWAVVLGGIVGLAIVVGAFVGFFTSVRNQREPELPATAQGRGGKPIEKPEFNFAITPSSRWVSMKPEAINKVACLAMRRPSPEVYFVVIGERSGGTMPLETLTEVSKANLAGASQVLNQREETITLNGMTFAHVTTWARPENLGRVLIYEHWLSTQRGFAWQVIFWSGEGDMRALAAESSRVMNTFRVLDPTMDGDGHGTLEDVTRPELGYATKIAGMGWNVWEDAAKKNALMDFSAERSNEALLVLPVRFDQTAAPDLEALTRALLHEALDLTYPVEGDYESKAWQPGHGGEGVELTTEHEVDGSRFHYLLRIARREDSAHLLAGWAEVKRGDRELVRKSLEAITLQPPAGAAPALTPARKTALGLLLNEAGLSFHRRKEFEKAAALFRQGFEQTGNDPNILGNAGSALEQAGKEQEGRDLLARHVNKFLKHFDVGTQYARLQALSGEVEAGNTTFLGLIERGLKNEDDLQAWLNLLTSEEHYPEALQAADRWVGKHPTTNARRWQAQTLFAAGKETESLGLLEKLLEENPKDAKVAYDLGGYYNDAGEHAKAAAVAEKLLADAKESSRALMILGWSQMGRKWYRDAKATFERAARQKPDDEEIKNAIRSASAMLGQGDNSGIRQPIEIVAIPEAVGSALTAQAVPADFGQGYSAAWLLRVSGWHFEKGKQLRRTVRRRVKVLTAEGARDFSSVEITFDPLGERVFMNRLEVTDAEGRPVAKGSLDDAYVRDLDDGTATHRKVLHMQVAGVQPGHVVEWEVTLEDLSKSDVFPFQRYLFANSLPVAVEAVFVTGDLSNLRKELAQGEGLKSVQTTNVSAWIAPARPSTPDEPYAIWPERRCPMLWLGGDGGTWEQVARDYLKEIEDRLKPDKSVEELAARVIAGLGTNTEKAAALARHVQKEYGYQAIEFGVRARRPNAAGETVKLRYGDCKDFSLLLHHLLRAAGVESHLALVATGWRLNPTLPSLDQFNHMVVHVPALGQGWLLDATDKSLDLGRHRAGGLWHAHAIILDPLKPRLIPPHSTLPPRSCEIASRRTITASGTPSGADWRVEETLTLEGYYAATMRSAFKGLSADEQSEKAQRLLAAQGPARVQDFRFEHLDQHAQPAILHFNYTVRDAIPKAGRAAPLPALWEHDYLQTAFVKDRRTAFEWLYPMHFTSEVTVKLPASATAESVAALKQQGQSQFCAWKLEPVRSGKGGGTELGLRFEFTAKPGEHAAASYAAFHDAWEDARRAWDKPVSWAAN